MGRTAKHNWQKLFLEYCQGRYKSVRQFAGDKGLNYDQVKKEFKKLQDQGQNEGKIEPENGGKKGQKTGVKKSSPKEKGQNSHSWITLKQQFADWPDDRLQAYVGQLNARKAELESIPIEELSQEEIKELGRIRRERRAILSDPDPERKCSAHNRDSSPCKNPAEHGKNVCWNHGGAPGSGCPPGTKNNLKHGAYETIWLDQLDDEERALAELVAQDEVKAAEEEIILLTVRERRMLARIARLTGEDFTVVKIKYEKGVGPLGFINKEDKESHATLGQVQQIEQELTRVQDKKLKAIELKYKLEKLKQDMSIAAERLKMDKEKQDGDSELTDLLDRALDEEGLCDE